MRTSKEVMRIKVDPMHLSEFHFHEKEHGELIADQNVLMLICRPLFLLNKTMLFDYLAHN